MLELWKAVGLVVVMVVSLGCVTSSVIFVKKVWDHVNQPHATINCNKIVGDEVQFSGDMKLNMGSEIFIKKSDKKGA